MEKNTFSASTSLKIYGESHYKVLRGRANSKLWLFSKFFLALQP